MGHLRSWETRARNLKGVICYPSRLFSLLQVSGGETRDLFVGLAIAILESHEKCKSVCGFIQNVVQSRLREAEFAVIHVPVKALFGIGYRIERKK